MTQEDEVTATEDIETLSDAELVQAARDGEPEAFNELIRRHRDRALGWAHSIARDRHAAEDIVQDAFVKTFLHLGTLADIGRFLPWLQRIVRNQAAHKMRRGGPYRHELPFTSMAAQTERASRVDYSDVDAILHFMAQTAAQSHNDRHNPLDLVSRSETIETIRALLRCLSRRERAIFEAHFFSQLAPHEIAGLFQTTTANIYMSLSRSRKKLSERARRQADFTAYAAKERSGAMMRRNILEQPRILHTKCHPYNASIRHGLHYMLPYIGRGEWTYAETMGITAHAFHINLERTAARMEGTFLYDGLSYTQNAMINLGMHNQYFDIMPVEKLPDAKRRDFVEYVLDTFRSSIDQGVPFLCPKGRHQQFDLAYGYDDERQLFYLANTKEAWTMPYSELEEGHLYAFVCDGRFDIDRKTAMLRALRLALRHAHGEDATFSVCVNGLAAYDTWMDIFRRRSADPLGNAASLAVVGDMRDYAAQFLRQYADTWPVETPNDPQVRVLLGEAALHYSAVARSFKALRTLFPFPSGGDPADPAQADAASRLLLEAKDAETEGLAVLQRMLDLLTDDTAGPEMPAIIPNDPFFY